MLTLAIDGSGMTASCALVSESAVIAEFSVNAGLTHSETLMPMIQSMMNESRKSLSDVDFISSATGPGSFTGLRIGTATAKGIAFGADKKIVPVPTLDALAYNVYGDKRLIVPIMDAKRSQVYTAVFEAGASGLTRITDYWAVSLSFLLEYLKNLGRDCLFLGDGVPVFRNELLAEGYALASPQNLMQRAATVGFVGHELYKQGLAVYPEQIELKYLRTSQAEREYEEKHGGQN